MTTRRCNYYPVLLLLAALLLSACNQAGHTAAAEVSAHFVASEPTDCPRPELPDASTLPAVEGLPDPFTNLQGEPINTQKQWHCRRGEISAQLQKYQAGYKPSAPEHTAGRITEERIEVEVQHEGQRIQFSAQVTWPKQGTAPYPAMIGVGFSNLDNDYLLGQGVALIQFDNNAMGAQAGGDSRGSGLFFDLYGADHSASSLTAWAWGISRLIDVIAAAEKPLLDPARLGVTGCSRNGKGALLTGALDERIALTIVQEAGAGGSASWRVSQAQADAGHKVQTLSHAAGEQPWFRASFGTDFGQRVSHLPIDQHLVMGLVAPRGLLVLDNDIDWLGPLSGFIATSAAGEIYRALGVPEHIAYSEGGAHQHCQLPEHQQDIVRAYIERFLLGTSADTGVMHSTKGDASAPSQWIDWSTPELH